MNPTELSEVEGINEIAEKAIGTNQRIILANLQMIPWTRQLQLTNTHKVPSTRGMAHWGYLEEEFLPRIQRYFPERMQRRVEYALGDALKNAFEEAEKIGLKEIIVENSPLGVLPVEFLVHSGVREVSPHFVKYWKYHKTHLKEKGFVDYENDFYKFTGLMPECGQTKFGSGLVKMLNFSNESGFYLASDNTLLTWMSFAKKE